MINTDRLEILPTLNKSVIFEIKSMIYEGLVPCIVCSFIEVEVKEGGRYKNKKKIILLLLLIIGFKHCSALMKIFFLQFTFFKSPKETDKEYIFKLVKKKSNYVYLYKYME